MIEVKKKEDTQFPIIIYLNSGKQYFTLKAAIELKNKLISILDRLEK